jgi:hypothetical protein
MLSSETAATTLNSPLSTLALAPADWSDTVPFMVITEPTSTLLNGASTVVREGLYRCSIFVRRNCLGKLEIHLLQAQVVVQKSLHHSSPIMTNILCQYMHQRK